MGHSTELVEIAVPRWKTHFKKQYNIQTLHKYKYHIMI